MMRSLALACLISLAAAGCNGKPLTGPEAQRAVAQARSSDGHLLPGTVVVVDGVRLPDTVRLGTNGLPRDLNPSTIDYVVASINPAVLQRYGPNAKRVYLIHTKGATQPFTPLEKVRASVHP